MKRIFTLVLGALAMIAVALISAFIAMRLAIHGREAVVPTLTGLTVADAGKAAASQGLHLALENRFYSSGVPAGRILAQDPAPGSRVRREWPVRITESLGGQRVNIPDLTGESERAATISIRRLSLDLGAVAHLAIPGDSDVVLTQTPPVNSAGVDGPRVSLLVSDPDDSHSPAYVMPSLVGLTFAAAGARASTAGLHLEVAVPPPPPPVPAASMPNAPPPSPSSSPLPPNSAPPEPPPAPIAHSASSIVLAQAPQPGRRVMQGDAVHITLGERTQPAAAATQN
jgi:eukaryotic-like serine/threonine-protein kinase